MSEPRLVHSYLEELRKTWYLYYSGYGSCDPIDATSL